jgi:sugar lactone lactonase YvrE
MRRMRLAPAFFLAASIAGASGTANWEMNSYQDFLRGRFNGVSLSRDGKLLLAPPLETVFTSEQPVIWSLVEAPDGTVYAGTGHRGRVYRIDKSGKGTLLWTSEQPEVFALAVAPDGALYAATSPNGRVYRIEKGKAIEYFAPGAHYIWALAFGPDGAMYVATGDEGKIFRVTSRGKGEVYYETSQANVTCLAVDGEGRLLAGTEPNGILYRITAKDKAFTLYDSNLPEIRTIVPAPGGTIYVAALGGSTARRAAAAAGATAAAAGMSVTATSSSITVSETSAQSGVDLKQRPSAPPPAPAAPQAAAAPLVDIAGVERSAVYRINPDNTVESLWSSKEENAYDLLARPNELMLATDAQGRVYRLSMDRKLTLVAETDEGEITRLAFAGGSFLAAVANQGRIVKLGPAPGAQGTFEAPVHDAGTVARWGRLSWVVEEPAAGRVKFQTRSGNSARPDKTWSDYADVVGDAGLGAVASPNARYLQWRATLEGAAGKAPVVEGVSVAYLPQNSPPLVKSINVTTQVAGATTLRPATPAAAAATYSVTITDTGETPPAASAGTPTQTLTRAAPPQVQISWQAEDLDGDRLIYAVHFRGEDEREWKLLKDNLTENTVALESELFADGRYFFRITASDRLANPPAAAREAELVSAPVLIDNTPPRVAAGAPRRNGAQVEIEFEATDSASPLRRAEYSVDASAWTPVEPVDGILDSPAEKFVVRFSEPHSGEHLVVFRAFDAAGNAGLAKVILR